MNPVTAQARGMFSQQQTMRWIRDEIKRRGLTQRQVADLSGICHPNVSRLMSGRNPKSSFVLLATIVAALGGRIVVEPAG